MRLHTDIYEPSTGPGGAQDIVLIHGTGARAEMWTRQIDPLRQAGFRCIVPDLRGHGGTSEPGEPAPLDVHVNDVLETLETTGLMLPAAFVGHSLGAIISMTIAERHPQLVREVFAVSMPGKVPLVTRQMFKWFLTWPYKSIKDTPLHCSLKWRERVLLDTDHFTLREIVRNFEHLDFSSAPPRVSCPVHFAVGRLDPVALCQEVEVMHRALPNSTLKVFEFAGHNCMDTHSSQFNAWLLAQLSKLQEAMPEPGPTDAQVRT